MEEQELVAVEDTEDTQSSQGNENVVNGVEYERDHDGNYMLNGVPIMDAKQVPFYNRTREADRKIADAERNLLELQANRAANVQEPVAPAEPQHDPEDVVPGMTMTYGELDRIKSEIRSEIQGTLNQAQSGSIGQMARIEQDRQLQAAQASPSLKGFFDNEAFVSELQAQMADCTPEMFVNNPNLVNQGIALIRGAHIDEIVREAENRGRSKGRQHREVIEEVQLGKPGGPNGVQKVPVNDEIRQIAAESVVSLEAAAEIWESRRKNKEKQGNGN